MTAELPLSPTRTSIARPFVALFIDNGPSTTIAPKYWKTRQKMQMQLFVRSAPASLSVSL
jgi:hypothetical protein